MRMSADGQTNQVYSSSGTWPTPGDLNVYSPVFGGLAFLYEWPFRMASVSSAVEQMKTNGDVSRRVMGLQSHPPHFLPSYHRRPDSHSRSMPSS